MHIGIPCMKCSLHPSSAVNKASGKKSKTCGLGSAWREMNDNRLGRDETIDKSLTEKNVWMVGSSDDDVESMVQKEIDSINEERKEHGKRALRSDAVSVIEIVEKPPMDYMQSLSDEERKKFLEDSHAVMEQMIHDWNPNWKIIESVQHWDEFGGASPHTHELVLITSKDKDGISTMNCKAEYGKKFFDHINQQYPWMMRTRGYDVEDVRTYDSLSEEEKEYLKLHPELKGGLDAVQYKKTKKKEMIQDLMQLESQKEELSRGVSDKEREHAEVSEKLATAKEDLIQTKQTTDETIKAGLIARQVIDESKQIQASLTAREVSVSKREETLAAYAGVDNFKQYKEVREENESLKKELSWKNKLIERLQEQNKKLKETLDSWRVKIQKIGSKMAHALGFKDEEYADGRQSEYPDSDVKKAYEEAVGEIRKIDPRSLRILPDQEHEGRYVLAIRQNDGKYQTHESGFQSRSEAEQRRRELSDAKLTLDRENVKEHSERLTR